MVREDTDSALRSYLGTTGAKKGSLFRFVDEAVRTRLFELAVDDIKARNRAYPQDEILAAVEEVRKALRATSGPQTSDLERSA